MLNSARQTPNVPSTVDKVSFNITHGIYNGTSIISVEKNASIKIFMNYNVSFVDI